MVRLTDYLLPKNVFKSFQSVDNISDNDEDDKVDCCTSIGSPTSAMTSLSRLPPDGVSTHTPSGVSTEVSSVTNDTATRENEENRIKIRHLEEQVAKFYAYRRGKTVNLRAAGKKPVISGQDRTNHLRLMPMVTSLFREMKWLPSGWEVHSALPDSLAARWASSIIVPHGISEKIYYEDTIAPMVMTKWRNTKTNFQASAKRYFDGNVLCVLHCFVTFIVLKLTHCYLLLCLLLFCSALCYIKSGITLEMMKQFVLSTNGNCFIVRAWTDKFDTNDDDAPQLQDVIYKQGVESMYRLIMELCTRLYTQVRWLGLLCVT
jgi:hypothetical protein